MYRLEIVYCFDGIFLRGEDNENDVRQHSGNNYNNQPLQYFITIRRGCRHLVYIIHDYAFSSMCIMEIYAVSRGFSGDRNILAQFRQTHIIFVFIG